MGDSVFRLLIAATLITVNTACGIAQNTAHRTQAHSAAYLVAEYAAGTMEPARRIATRSCPRDTPLADSVLTGLLALPTTPRRVANLSVGLSAVIAKCQDSRVDAWFRANLLTSQGTFPALHLANGLLSHPTVENVEAVKASAFAKERGSDLRTYILEAIVSKRALSPRARVDLFAEVYEKSGLLPEPYASLEGHKLKRTTEAAYWRKRMLQSLVNHPEHVGAISLLEALGSDAIFDDGAADAGWRRELSAAMAKLDVDARANDDLKRAARQTKKLLDEKN